jgi:hypothetical protein
MKILVKYDKVFGYSLTLNGAKCVRKFDSLADAYVYILRDVWGHEVTTDDYRERH